jgi:hypothetical protein
MKNQLRPFCCSLAGCCGFIARLRTDFDAHGHELQQRVY